MGSKNYSNDKCSSSYLDENGQAYLGSQKFKLECLDFVNKETCDKYPGYTWSNKHVWKILNFQ